MTVKKPDSPLGLALLQAATNEFQLSAVLMYKAGVRPTGPDLILNNNHFAMLRVLVRAGWLCKTGRAAQSMYALTPQGLDVRSKLPPPVRPTPQAICRLCGGVHYHKNGCLLARPNHQQVAAT